MLIICTHACMHGKFVNVFFRFTASIVSAEDCPEPSNGELELIAVYSCVLAQQ